MRILFVTYCFADGRTQALIGVYKRGLRIALELQARGHEILFDCTGRRDYRDDLTAVAHERIEFVDLGLHPGDGLDELESRRRGLQAMALHRPDLVVVGEAPLAGTLLEGTLCAVELGIPVALLDNAYNPGAVEQFLAAHGGMMDGVVLTGPSCAHIAAPPPLLCQVPPFVATDPEAAAALVRARFGGPVDRLVCVLAYDGKVERLAVSLLERLERPGTRFLFMSKRPAECERALAGLPAALRAQVSVLGLLPDALLFGLLERSRLAITKYGFMQVTECTALRTPVICAYHEGPAWLEFLPSACRRFVHAAEGDEADEATVTAARRLLDVSDDAMRPIHDGRFDATAAAADFLERLPREPRRDAWTEAVERFPAKLIRRALRATGGDHAPDIASLRTMRLRLLPGEEVHELVCRCTVDDGERFVRLWGRRYKSGRATRRARREAERSGRRVLAASPRRRTLIEADLGQEQLPPI